MATKIYTESGVFEVNASYEDVLHGINEVKKPPFVFEATMVEGDRRVTVVTQYVVAVEDCEYE
jgi:hypothetical protein